MENMDLDIFIGYLSRNILKRTKSKLLFLPSVTHNKVKKETQLTPTPELKETLYEKGISPCSRQFHLKLLAWKLIIKGSSTK